MFKNSFNIFNNLYKLTTSSLSNIQERSLTKSIISLNLSKQQEQLANLNNDSRYIKYKSYGTCCDPCDEQDGVKPKLAQVHVGNYNKKWVKDRCIVVSLIVAMPLALIYPTHIGDVFLITSVMLHQHWGIEGVVRDYAREKYFGKTKPKVAIMIVRLITMVVTCGLLYFTYTQCCIGESIRKFWSIKGCPMKSGRFKEERKESKEENNKEE